MIPRRNPARHMKKCLLCVVLLLPVAIWAQETVRIDHVGLGSGEIFGSVLPTPVRVHIPALSQSQNLELQFQFSMRQSDKSPLIPLADRISRQVQVSAGTPLDIELPVPLPLEAHLALHLIVLDGPGRKIGEATRELETQWRGNQNLMAIYCVNIKVCDEATSQVNINVEARKESQSRRIVQPLREP